MWHKRPNVLPNLVAGVNILPILMEDQGGKKYWSKTFWGAWAKYSVLHCANQQHIIFYLFYLATYVCFHSYLAWKVKYVTVVQ